MATLRERIDEWCERGILGFVLAILVIGPLAFGAVRTSEFVYILGLTAGALVLWIVRMWIGDSPRFLWPPVTWVVLAFTALAIVRYYQADIEYVARLELLRIVVYASLFMVIVNQLHRQESMLAIAMVMIFLGMAIAIYAAYQFATQSDHIWHLTKPENYKFRGTGTYVCPNHLAGYLEMLLPVSLALVFLSRLGHVTKVLLGYAALVILAGILVSFSRGGWVVTSCTLAVLFFIIVKKSRLRWTGLVLFVVLIGISYLFVSRSLQSKQRLSEVLVSGELRDIRTKIWGSAYRMWQDHPWFGVGPGHFDHFFPKYRPIPFPQQPLKVHNDYLNTLTDWGVAGAALISLAWVLVGFVGLKTWKYVRNPGNDLASKRSTRAALVVGCGAGLGAILLHSWVDFNFQIPANAITAITLMALLSAHARFATDAYWVARRWFLQLTITVLCLVACAFLGYQGYHLHQESGWIGKAQLVGRQSVRAIPYLDAAFAVEPANYATAYDAGEAWRKISWQGNDNYQETCEKAISWFQRALAANPLDAFACARLAMCLDWLGRHSQAEKWMKRTEELDGNNHYLVAIKGWHLMQLANYEEKRDNLEAACKLYDTAFQTFLSSCRLQINSFAQPYEAIAKRKVDELQAILNKPRQEPAKP